MKHYTTFFAIMVLLGLFGSIRFIDDNDYQSNVIILHANIDNRENDARIDNARVKFLVMDDYGAMGSSFRGDVRGGDVQSKVATANVYGDMSGEYMVRIYAYGDDGERSIKHRLITIE